MSGSQAMPKVDPVAHLLLPIAFAMAHSEIRVVIRKLRPGVSMGTRKLLRPPAFVDSQFGKRDAGEPHAKVHHFGVNTGVEVDVTDAATEIADVELRLGDGGDADRLVVSAR